MIKIGGWVERNRESALNIRWLVFGLATWQAPYRLTVKRARDLSAKTFFVKKLPHHRPRLQWRTRLRGAESPLRS